MYESTFVLFELEASPTGLIALVVNLVIGLDPVTGHRGLYFVPLFNVIANVFP